MICEILFGFILNFSTKGLCSPQTLMIEVMENANFPKKSNQETFYIRLVTYHKFHFIVQVKDMFFFFSKACLVNCINEESVFHDLNNSLNLLCDVLT